MRRTPVLAAAAIALTGGAALASTAAVGTADGPSHDYVVLLKPGTGSTAAARAVRDAGGRITSFNRDIGVAQVTSSRGDFARQANRSSELQGAALDAPIGRATPDGAPAHKDRGVEAPQHAKPSAKRAQRDGGRGGDPYTDWDMDAIGANATGSYAKQRGSHDVRVGIIDTGIDGNHPDIAPNFDRDLSRNFTTDKPDIDGPCEEADCVDPADVDQDGHGTHVAGTVGAALNGLGMAGVAPDVDLVNIRAGQDSGYFFTGPTVDALTYAGDNGIDVVNMSFYVDPWLFNCSANPADTPEQQAEQRTIVDAVQRAVDYAHDRGVTMVSAAGNDTTDLANKTSDETSPDYPDGAAHPRTIDNSCLSMPTEANHVLAVSSTGPSGRKAFYSNWGAGQIDVAAPGGDSRDFPGTDQTQTVDDLVLAPFPTALGEANDALPADSPDRADAIRTCANGTCAYYQYIQGTSMASPHATGVAALIVAEFGTPDPNHPGLTLSPDAVAQRMEATATPKACPEGGTQTYVTPASDPTDYTATCEGGERDSSFFGAGLVNADRAVTRTELGEQVGVPPSAGTVAVPVPVPGAAPAQLVSFETSTSFARSRRATLVRELRVGSSSRGATVRIRCFGGGCAGGTRTYAVGEAPRSIRGALSRARLHSGAKLVIEVRAPGYLTREVTYTARAGRQPSRAVRTLG